ncbi:conserved hypothetical protein [Nautilia profundicola AmH]|uniref:DUF3373 domain-containing protein n=1 Tax=Nautilia profundicola (strain ATCC BAA-1463 / DSM 18972 / AmH) TaxID=598659 RepID=B9L6B9_NAUPA|nr:DUF3373 family protein [Nautilia profundicola]ACM92255.1 conserved hypothetical protein [Nautilia profundicola AmH]
MKKLLLSATVVAGLFAAPTIDTLQKQINDLQQQLKELKAKQTEQNDRYYKKVAPIVANNHLFWSYDLRTTYDAIFQETTDGMGVTNVQMDPTTGQTVFTFAPVKGEKINNHIFTNRVILTGVYKPSDNLKATVRVEANNMFGSNDASNMMVNPFQNVPWVANETPDDINFRLKEAFFNYYFGDDLMFSAGRRPATNGYPANLREGDDPASPLAHLINMEFDGFSFKIGNGEFSKITDKFGDWGTWLKFCAGRGYSSATGKWPSNFAAPYSRNDALKNMDFAGFIFVPYDDGQYSLWTETVWAWHVQGYTMNYDATVALADPTKAVYEMSDTGNYFGENVMLKADGIGDGISDFLDDTKAFVSFAYSKVKGNGKLLGQDSTGNPVYEGTHSGHSVWVGADMPGFKDGDRFGLSYVKGSKYWRSFTYGEDTLAGSIAAVRGKAVDVYYNTEIVPHLTAGLRYTYIKYDHAGSDGFFGMMADPDVADNFSYVKKATDIRAYIRYKF